MPATKTTNKIRQTPPWQIVQYDSQAPINSDVVEAASPCIFLDVIALNKGAATLYVMVFDTTSVPANATIPLFQPVPVPAGTQVVFSLNDLTGGGTLVGMKTTNGLCWAASTTVASLTVDATSSLWATIRYLKG